MVTVKNKANGVISVFTEQEWEEINNNPAWKNTFQVVKFGREDHDFPELKKQKTTKKTETPT